jgi:hypothetical protein
VRIIIDSIIQKKCKKASNCADRVIFFPIIGFWIFLGILEIINEIQNYRYDGYRSGDYIYIFIIYSLFYIGFCGYFTIFWIELRRWRLALSCIIGIIAPLLCFFIIDALRLITTYCISMLIYFSGSCDASGALEVSGPVRLCYWHNRGNLEYYSVVIDDSNKIINGDEIMNFPEERFSAWFLQQRYPNSNSKLPAIANSRTIIRKNVAGNIYLILSDPEIFGRSGM